MTKYIAFDFDGTLVDSQNIAISVVNQLAKKHNFKSIEKENIDYLKSLSVLERCKFLNVPVYKLPFWAPEFYRIYKDSIKHLCFFDGISDLLNQLADLDYKLAIISSNSENIIRDFLKRKQIENVDQIFCSSNLFGKNKVIKKFLKKNKLKNSELIYVGDESRDIIACKEVGVEIIWVSWGYDSIDTIKEESPDYIAKEPQDILSIVKSLSD
ncbi:HAD family hydrolase [Orenia metallireducens]|jgi:phosphoglycolate phosphatase|uniref:HAD family hydrolase n=1 Tax=Orenia metallireducens TaxID=1413210 RepID=A0A1C0A809_9FIRM|nr:HAD-IA family hydrolase [Orenia metallireducens]OCL26386.1 HAD family hydrolase [Orenia metallireducens]